MDSLQQEIFDLRHQAEERLRKGHNPEPDNATRLFQVLIIPSFDNYLSVEVFKRQQYNIAQFPKYQYFAIQIIWRKDQDYEKLRNPVVRLKYPPVLKPTYEAHIVELDDEFVEGILAKFSNLPVETSYSKKQITIDGIGFELFIDGGAHYDWRTVRPGLETLQQLVDNVVTYTKQCISRSTR